MLATLKPQQTVTIQELMTSRAPAAVPQRSAGVILAPSTLKTCFASRVQPSVNRHVGFANSCGKPLTSLSGKGFESLVPRGSCLFSRQGCSYDPRRRKVRRGNWNSRLGYASSYKEIGSVCLQKQQLIQVPRRQLRAPWQRKTGNCKKSRPKFAYARCQERGDC